MFKFISKMFTNSEIRDLKNQITDLKIKLEEKQEHINATNAYWKKKMFATKSKKKEL